MIKNPHIQNKKNNKRKVSSDEADELRSLKFTDNEINQITNTSIFLPYFIDAAKTFKKIGFNNAEIMTIAFVDVKRVNLIANICLMLVKNKSKKNDIYDFILKNKNYLYEHLLNIKKFNLNIADYEKAIDFYFTFTELNLFINDPDKVRSLVTNYEKLKKINFPKSSLLTHLRHNNFDDFSKVVDDRFNQLGLDFLGFFGEKNLTTVIAEIVDETNKLNNIVKEFGSVLATNEELNYYPFNKN